MKTILIFLVLVLAGGGVYYYSTRESTVPEVSYYIDKQQVTKEAFMELKGQLAIDVRSVTSSSFEVSQGVFGGNEEEYQAIKKDNSKVYTYTIITYTNGNIKASIVAK